MSVLDDQFSDELMAKSTESNAVSIAKKSLFKLQGLLVLRIVDFTGLFEIKNKKEINDQDEIHVNSILNHQHDFQQSYDKIKQHRMKYYSAKAPHLATESELNNSHELDARSVLLGLEVENKIVVSLRVTPRPFELEVIDNHNENLTPDFFRKYDDYAELGRLVSDPDLDPINAALLTRYLLCLTGLYSFEDWGKLGFVAICRPFRLSYFKKFGLKDQFTVYNDSRKLLYHFLSASKEEILQQVSELQLNEEYLIKRLSKSFRDF